MFNEWVEKNLQDPFYRAEIHRAGINLETRDSRDFGTIKTLAVFGTAYTVFCVYCYAKYLAA